MATKKYLDENGLAYYHARIKEFLNDKVDVEAGKGLSANDYTNADKAKLEDMLAITSVGENLDLTDGVLSATDTTYSDFIGASSSASGESGLVPAPLAGDESKYLSGDGLWKTITPYSLPIASSTTLGGVKIGTDLSIDQSGVLTTNLATVASTGSYSDLLDKPTIPVVPTNVSAFTNDAGYQTSSQVSSAIEMETQNREAADNNLQSQIDGITASSDVKDIVGTYAELQDYDTSALGDNDIIKVLQDEAHSNETTYYRWSTSTDTFTLIGEEGPYYTKSQTDTLLNAKANISSLATVATTGSYSDLTNKPSIPTKTSDLTNDSNFVSDASYVHTDNNFTSALKTKLDGIAAGAEVNVQANWTQTDTSADDYIKNKPTIPPAITVDSALSSSSTNPVQNKVINTALGKKVNDMTIQLGLQTSGVHLSKFLTYNYSNTTQYNAKLLKINISSGHPGGNSFKFYEEVIVSANYTGNVSVNVFRYYGQSTGSPDQHYGDIFWTIDTTNKIVEFYITSGQYTSMYMSPYKMLIPTTGEGLTQHSGTAVEYSSGEKHWANVYDLGLMDGFSRPTYKGTGVALTSDIPSVDSSLSSTSTNPVQNKVINTALAAKANSADLATVATSGSYNDLLDTPIIPPETKLTAGDNITLTEAVDLPSGYTQVEYVTMPSGSYIDTGVQENNFTDPKIITTFKMDNPGDLDWFGGGTPGIIWNVSVGAIYIRWGSTNTRSFSFVGSAGPYDLVFYDFHKLESSGTTTCTVRVDDKVIATSSSGFEGFSSGQTIRINRSNRPFAASATWKGFKIYNGDTLLFDGVPCINPSNEVGMFDTVSQTFFGNQGSGSFVAGNVVEGTMISANVNNATLTIQQNSSTVGTFTANANANKTINITVPTAGSIASGNTGYATGGDVYNAIGDVETVLQTLNSGSGV